MTKINCRGLMLVLSSPSGAGKTTICRNLLLQEGRLLLSISHTTRAPREGEIHGRDYYFTSHDNFNHMVSQNEFLEHAYVFKNHYGTLKKPVDEALKEGKDVLFDIDWQGTQQLKQSARSDVVSIFVLPPSWKELESRLNLRAKDSADTIGFRMSKAYDEIQHWAEYDYIIINEEIQQTVKHVAHILAAERLRRERQQGLTEFVRDLTPNV